MARQNKIDVGSLIVGDIEINIGTPSNGQILSYNSVTGKYESTTVSIGSGGGNLLTDGEFSDSANWVTGSE